MPRQGRPGGRLSSGADWIQPLGIWNLIKFGLIALAVWLLYRSVRSLLSGRPSSRPMPRGPDQVIDVMVQDPQCGTYLPRHEAIKAWAFGEERFFCSEACRDAFLQGKKPQEQKEDARPNG